jgi:hypothetical protein
MLCYITGSHQECRYTLLTFGIQSWMIPLDDSNDHQLQLEEFTKHMQDRKRLEAEAEAAAKALELANSTIPYPSRLDVLHGRGKPYQEYSGNACLNTLVTEHIERFKQAGSTYGHKNEICKEVIQMIRDSGGRFLKRCEDENGWEVVTDQLVMEKVSHAFRTRKYRQLK